MKTTLSAADLMPALCRVWHLPIPEPEVRFAPPRKWRFDFLWEGWLALEVQGGIWNRGRHVRPADMLKEYEKLNRAAIMGYSVLFCTPGQIKDGSIFPVIKEALKR